MPNSIRPGDVLADRYLLVDLLSESGSGRFWRAHDRILDRHVSVHVLAPDDERAEGLMAAARLSAAQSIARATAGGSGTRTTLPPLPRTRSTRWPCSSPRSAMLAPQASKMRSPSRPRSATNAKSFTLVDRRAV